MVASRTRTAALAALIATSLAGVAHADVVRVVIRGSVDFNGFASGALAGVPSGAPVRVVMDLDSAVYLDSVALPGRTRGYPITPGTLAFTAGAVTVGARPGYNAYFCLQNNDPRADGLFLSQGTDIDTQIPLLLGTTQAFGVAFSHGFNGAPPPPSTLPAPTLTSLNILDAAGTYGFENLSRYNFAVQLNENVVPMVLNYDNVTIFTVCGRSDIAGPGQSPESDGQLTADDIIVYLNWFFASDNRADIAGPGQSTTTDGQFTADDIIVFLNRFFAGC